VDSKGFTEAPGAEIKKTVYELLTQELMILFGTISETN